MKKVKVRGWGVSPLVDPEDFMPMFSPPDADLSADAVVIGAGFSGVVCAYELQKTGRSVVLIAEDLVGSGATRYSSGICSGDGGVDLRQLVSRIGQEQAVSWYRECAQSALRLEEIVTKTGSRCDFQRKDVFYYTESEASEDALKEECRLRYHIGIPCRILPQEVCAESYSFPVRAGILTVGGGAQFRPVRFCRDTASYLSLHGVTVLEGTKADGVQAGEKGNLVCLCGSARITASVVVDTRGGAVLDKQPHLGRRMAVFSSVTAPVAAFSGWKDQNLIKGFDSFFFLRTTPDRRIISTGYPSRRILPEGVWGILPTERFIRSRIAQEEQDVYRMFIGVSHLQGDGGFCQEMISTPTGLPYVGRDGEIPGLYYLYAFGEAGIAGALCGARMIARFCGDKKAAFPSYLAA